MARLSRKLMPCITMAGTAPIFYLIPVSQDLVHAVGCGDFPVDETVITRFIPRVPQMGYPTVGMEPLANRHIIFQCFQAFKAFVVCFFLDRLHHLTHSDRFECQHCKQPRVWPVGLFSQKTMNRMNVHSVYLISLLLLLLLLYPNTGIRASIFCPSQHHRHRWYPSRLRRLWLTPFCSCNSARLEG